VAAGSAFVLFDHDLMRMTGIWTGAGFIDYESILLNDRHNIFPRTVGTIQVENPITPGWANPATGDFADPRFVAVDGRPFGPLPREWTHYTGLYRHGRRVVIAYTVGDADVLESYDLQKVGGPYAEHRRGTDAAHDADRARDGRGARRGSGGDAREGGRLPCAEGASRNARRRHHPDRARWRGRRRRGTGR
jgi:hypothetical protein